jgi:hypothetical protein
MAYYVPQWGIFGPWSAGILYGMILGLYLRARFRSGRWKTMQAETEARAKGFDVTMAAAVEPIGK